MRKRLFSICVALVALMVTPLAAWALNVSPGNVSGGPGASITVPINISDVGGGLAVDAFDFTINFDQDVLTFVEADKTGTLTNSFTSVAGNIIGPGTVKVAGILFGTPINISSPGVFVNIKFTVKATAYKNSPLSLSDFKSDIAGASTNPATFTITGVTVTVNLTPASVNNVVAGQPVTLTAEVLINGTPLDLTNPNDVNFATSGGGTFGAKSVVAGDVVVNYTTPALVQTANITATETVTGNNRLDTSTITSIAGPLATLTVAPDTATLTADETRPFSVTGVDANNNPVTGSGLGTITWTVNGGIGTIDNNGLFAATNVGTGSITATSSSGNISDQSGTITVTAGALASLTVSPDTATLNADQTQQFTVTGKDADGNAVSPLGTVTWGVTGGIGTIDGSGLFSASKVGTGTVTATVGTVTDSSGTITVTAGALATLTVSPDTATVALNRTQQFTVTGNDADGNAVTNLGTITWSVTGSVGAIDSTGLFTAGGTEGTCTVTATSNLGKSDTSGTITVSRFSATPDFNALVTTGTPHVATITAIGATSYNWSKVSGPGTLSASTGTVVTFTAPNTITGGINGDPTVIRVTDATNASLFFDLTITTYNPVAVTWPTSAAGIAIGDNTKIVTASGGTGTYKFESSDPTKATINVDTGALTPVAAGTITVKVRDATYGDFADANGFLAVTPNIEIVAPIVVSPAATSLLARETQQFGATGGKGGGTAANYTWSVNNAGAGSINANGLFTAANVTAAQTATVTATDKTYANIKGTATVNVYSTLTIQLPAGYDPNNPATWPLVLSGGTYALQVLGGEGTSYSWSVTGPLPVTGGTGSAFEFIAPTEGAFAGVYAVTVRDGQTGKTFSINMKVPMTITPSNLSMLGDSTVIYGFDVAGAPEGSSFAVSLVTTGKANITNPDEYGTVTYNPDEFFSEEALAGFDFTPADITGAYKSFLFKVQATEVGGVTPLKDAGLDILYSGVMNILPVVEFTGRVENEGGAPIVNVDVKMLLGDDVVSGTTTDALGEFSFRIADPASTGQITAVFAAAGYVTQAVPLAGWVNPEVIVLVTAAGSVSGNVSEFEGGPIEGALVESALDDQVLAAVTDSGGNYTLGLPRALAEGEVLNARASKLGYVAVVQDVALNPDFILNPQSQGPQQDVCEAGGTFEWDSAIVKIPEGALDGCFTIEVNDNIPVGTETLYTGKSVVLVEIKIPPAALPLAKPIIVTIPYDTAEVQPGDFKAGNAVIYHAPTVDDLRNGTNLKKVATSDIISQDPFSGLVTFQVSTLSIFGVGGAQAAPAPVASGGGGGSGSGCFIASMDGGSASQGGLAGLAFLILALGTGTWTLRRSAK
jgi:hypothetical protein